MTNPTSKTAFALIGDRFHNSDYIRSGLSKTLGGGLELSINFSDDVKLLNAKTLARHALLIVFRDGMIWPQGYGTNAPYPGYDPQIQGTLSDPPAPELEPQAVQWISAEQGQAVRAFVEAGGAALFYHNSTYITNSEDFSHVHGSVTEGHPPVRPYKVQITNKDHPITRDVADFVVTDEQHYMRYDKDPQHILAVSINEDGHTFKDLSVRCEAAWAYDYGQGRVCYLSPGHTIPALWNPEYEKLQRNAAGWLLRQI
jgi:type 1 glutamine amidotransferase